MLVSRERGSRSRVLEIESQLYAEIAPVPLLNTVKFLSK